jgi:nucleotide-binding universal stress UspA family protein
MPKIQRILFPVDFSDQNAAIAPHVLCLARRHNAHVTLLNALEVPAAADPVWPAYGTTIDIPGILQERKKRIESFLKDEFQDISTDRLVLEGDPAWRIGEVVEERNIDLVMMPTHGYGPFRRFLLGSVTAKVLHDVKCPVWTSAHTPEPPRQPGYRNILCAVDLGTSSLALLRWTAEFAGQYGAALRVVHAIPAAESPVVMDLEGDRFRGFLFEQARQGLDRLCREANLKAETFVEGGGVADVVHKVANATETDLVVIGRGLMQHTLGSLRTEVYSIIREAPCPVISV